MVVFNRGGDTKIVSKATIRGLLIAVVIYMVVLINAAVQLSHAQTNDSYGGAIGPLRLFVLSLSGQGDQKTGSINFQIGTIIYLLIVVLAVLMVSVIVSKNKPKP